MNAIDLLEAIGELEEPVIARAERTRIHPRIWLRAAAGTAAACLLLAVMVPYARIVFGGCGAAAPDEHELVIDLPTAGSAEGIRFTAEITDGRSDWVITDPEKCAAIAAMLERLMSAEVPDTELSVESEMSESPAARPESAEGTEVPPTLTVILIGEDGGERVWLLKGCQLSDGESTVTLDEKTADELRALLNPR